MEYIEHPYLDDEEREIIESLNRGEWSPLSDEDQAREAAKLINAARSYFGLPSEKDPQIPPRRQPLSLAELIAQLPEDRQAGSDAIPERRRPRNYQRLLARRSGFGQRRSAMRNSCPYVAGS